MKNLNYLIVVIVLFGSQLSCQIFDPKPKSEEFYCKIGGKKFRPDNGGDMFFEALLLQLDRDNKRFNITAIKSGNGDERMSVLFSIPTKNKVLEERKYEITQEGKAYCSKGYISVGGSNKNHDYDAFLSSGYIIFSKVDTLKRRVSGTFAFKAKSNYTNDEIAVTDGQFNDVFYY
jgi:hypothetical protein